MEQVKQHMPVAGSPCATVAVGRGTKKGHVHQFTQLWVETLSGCPPNSITTSLPPRSPSHIGLRPHQQQKYLKSKAKHGSIWAELWELTGKVLKVSIPEFTLARHRRLKHNGAAYAMPGSVYFPVSVRGWKQMTESFAREHFALRIKIGWLGLNLSKEQPQIPHSQTLHGSHLRCVCAVVEEDITLSCHLLQKPFKAPAGLWRICGAPSKEAQF